MQRCVRVMFFFFHTPGCVFSVGVNLAGRLLMYNRVCIRRLGNGAMTSEVTSLITSVTFSQMSFLCY